MKVLITGGLGFVGTETRRLLGVPGSGWPLVYDLMEGRDICDLQQLTEYVAEHKPQVILHLAAIARFAEADSDPLLAYRTNVLGTENVVQVAKQFHLPLVYASTGSVYMPIKQEPPITERFAACGNSVYGVTKYLGELLVRQCNPHIILRYAHLYGNEKRNHGLIGGFLSRIERGLAPSLYGGKQSNDFTYIKDVARANLLAISAPWDKWNQTYNIGTGEELSAAAAAQAICRVFGYEGEIEVNEQRTVDPDRFVYDCSKAAAILGFKAEYSFEAGLKDMHASGTKLHDLASRVKRIA